MSEHGLNWQISVAMAGFLKGRSSSTERTGEFYRTPPRTAKPASLHLVSKLTRCSLKLRPQGSGLPTLFREDARPRSGISSRLLLALLAGATCVACTATLPPPDAQLEEPAAVDYAWRLPPGFPLPAVPADNPMSAAKVELGRHLFFDRRLSATGDFACASCHRQELAFTDGRARAKGATGELHPRGSMSLTGVAYNVAFAWADPNLASLEDQALVPMFNRDPVELGVEGDGAAMVARLSRDPAYEAMFAAAFPGAAERISVRTVVQAIAAFERTLISGNSAYDRRVYLDDSSAMSEAAKRGMRLFFSDRAGCFHCHSGFNFSGPTVAAGAPLRRRPVPLTPLRDHDSGFHNTGLYNLGAEGGRYPADNPGLAEHTANEQDHGRFRTPTLRNVALTAPYMHDGSIATLEEVVEHYAAGGRTIWSGLYAGVGSANPRKSSLVKGFLLTGSDQGDLVAFLESLTDEEFVTDPRFSDPFATVPAAAR